MLQKWAQPDLLKAAVISTMSILAVPLEASASAETCQPANSMANMPIFIAVALIGAAVGGKICKPVYLQAQLDLYNFDEANHILFCFPYVICRITSTAKKGGIKATEHSTSPN